MLPNKRLPGALNRLNTQMKKSFLLLISAVIIGFSMVAETIAIKNPGYFENPIRDGAAVFPDTLYFDSDAKEITFPDMGSFVQLGDYGFSNLRKVIVNNVDYMPGGTFNGMQNLEEIVINGLVGHFDCYFVGHCPKLRKVVFNGPVSSTGGPGFKYDCPQLDSVIFNNVVVNFCLDTFPEDLTPQFKQYTVNGAIISAANDSLTPPTDEGLIKSRSELVNGLKAIAKWQSQVLKASEDNKWMRRCAYEDAKILCPVLSHIDAAESAALNDAMEFAWNHTDDVKTYLEILKESPAYASDTITKPDFAYVLPSDAMLTETRNHFNLDSIAGDGDDISRIKNLLYWVHNNIRHDGGNGFPEGPRNLKNIYSSAKRNSCGYNCRALAISLTEALLAEGIPARYLTCESKKWDSDNDCHVICVAWSNSLNKWIWVDPTFAAYITDESGLLLHPGEVRYRLQHDLPVVLNSDANWNNQSIQTKENYLDDYMAKNLYILSANLLNQAEPEGKSNHLQGYVAALVPEESNYTNAHYITTDSNWFWQPPQAFRESSRKSSDISTGGGLRVCGGF